MFPAESVHSPAFLPNTIYKEPMSTSLFIVTVAPSDDDDAYFSMLLSVRCLAFLNPDELISHVFVMSSANTAGSSDATFSAASALTVSASAASALTKTFIETTVDTIIIKAMDATISLMLFSFVAFLQFGKFLILKF